MIHPIPRFALLVTLGSALALLPGCGGAGADRSKSEAKVSGVVKYQGKLVTSGEVTFNASNSERQVGGSSSKIGPDGTYALTTFAGANAIRFAGPFIDKDRTLQYKKRVLTVKAGDNPNIDFDLGSENDEAKGPPLPQWHERPGRQEAQSLKATDKASKSLIAGPSLAVKASRPLTRGGMSGRFFCAH